MGWIGLLGTPGYLFLAVVIVVGGILVMLFAKKGKFEKFAIVVAAAFASLFLIAAIFVVIMFMYLIAQVD